jgi:hypothetical protein
MPDGMRLGPAEARHDEQQRPQRVEVGERVECQAAVEARRVIPQAGRRPGMGELMHREGDDEREQAGDQLRKGEVEHV